MDKKSKALQFENCAELSLILFYFSAKNTIAFMNKCVLFQLFAYCTGFLYSDDVLYIISE